MADPDEDVLFERASKFLERNRDMFSQEQLLQCYGLYKQATFGPCNIPKPGIFDQTGRAKWCAWNKLKDLDQTSAKRDYIALMQPHMPEDDQQLNHNTREPGWVSVSRMQRVEEVDAPNEPAGSLVSSIKDYDEDAVRKLVERNDVTLRSSINRRDDNGIAPIHWAADHGNVTILSLVLKVPGIDINLRDGDGQTALHYAASCGNAGCVRVLLQRGADLSIQDDKCQSVTDVAVDEETQNLLYCELTKGY
uniref:Acyl-CoA-binding domain-containing protein 6 n=1 Tax=Anopheles farauti TaxID=69004 RepID=A0A182QXI7_9DIPT